MFCRRWRLCLSFVCASNKSVDKTLNAQTVRQGALEAQETKVWKYLGLCRTRSGDQVENGTKYSFIYSAGCQLMKHYYDVLMWHKEPWSRWQYWQKITSFNPFVHIGATAMFSFPGHWKANTFNVSAIHIPAHTSHGLHLGTLLRKRVFHGCLLFIWNPERCEGVISWALDWCPHFNKTRST